MDTQLPGTLKKVLQAFLHHRGRRGLQELRGLPVRQDHLAPHVLQGRLLHLEVGHRSPSSHGSANSPNMELNLAPFGRWALRDKAAQRRLALR